jgi:glutaredoxin 3
MPPVIVYTIDYCPYCHSAKRLLKQKAVDFQEIDLSGNAKERQKLSVKAAGRTSVPQIWIGDYHVGGCDDLYALEDSGKLDALLHGKS